MEIVLNVAFVIAAVAFFKQQFHLSGWQPIVCAFVLALLVAFLPDIYLLLPVAKPIVEKVVFVIALFLAAPGVFDLAVDLRGR